MMRCRPYLITHQALRGVQRRMRSPSRVLRIPRRNDCLSNESPWSHGAKPLRQLIKKRCQKLTRFWLRLRNEMEPAGLTNAETISFFQGFRRTPLINPDIFPRICPLESIRSVTFRPVDLFFAALVWKTIQNCSFLRATSVLATHLVNRANFVALSLKETPQEKIVIRYVVFNTTLIMKSIYGDVIFLNMSLLLFWRKGNES